MGSRARLDIRAVSENGSSRLLKVTTKSASLLLLLLLLLMEEPNTKRWAETRECRGPLASECENVSSKLRGSALKLVSDIVEATEGSSPLTSAWSLTRDSFVVSLLFDPFDLTQQKTTRQPPKGARKESVIAIARIVLLSPSKVVPIVIDCCFDRISIRRATRGLEEGEDSKADVA